MWRGFGAIALIAVLGIGCAGRFKAPRSALNDPSAVLALVDARIKGIKNIAIEARASYYDAKMVRKGKVELVAMPPASLFFSALSPTGDMLSAFASDGKSFAFFARGSKQCYTGLSCPANVSRFLPIPLDGPQLVRLTLGAVPFLRTPTRTVRWDTEVGAYCVTLTDAKNRVQRLWIKHKTGIVVRALMRSQGKLEYDITFTRVKKVGKHHLPHRIQVKMSLRKIDLRLDVRDVELDSADVNIKTFQLTCPAGTDKVTLPCQ